MWQGKKVSVAFPVFNEAEGIEKAVKDFFIPGVVDEIVVVDNNSSDASASIAAKAGARVVSENLQGYGFAVRRGMSEVTGDLLILAEPDGTFAGADILKLLVYSDDFDVVIGTRTTPQLIWDGANMGLFLRYGNWIVAKMLQLLFNTSSLSDCGCTLRLFHRSAAQTISKYLTVGGSHLLPEIVIVGHLLGLRMIEVPVHYRNRLGTSKITGSFTRTIRVGMRMILMIWFYRFKSWFGFRPRS